MMDRDVDDFRFLGKTQIATHDEQHIEKHES
jgi:hypothetical protein